jgi:hypothetical protein
MLFLPNQAVSTAGWRGLIAINDTLMRGKAIISLNASTINSC